MVSCKLSVSNPKAVAGLFRAVNKGMIAIAKDQNAGMKAAVNYDNRSMSRWKSAACNIPSTS